MASTYTTNKSIEKPANGDYVNTWSTPVNNDWDIIDVSLGGTTTLNATGVSGTTTLTASQYRPPTIIVTGVLTANVTYRIPSGVGGQWVVYNNTTGAFSLTFDSGGGGTSTVITQGARVLIYSDGTNVALGVTTTPSTAAGSSGQIQFNSGGALAGSTNLTYDGSANVVLGATSLARLDVRDTLRLYGSTSGYVGLTVPAAAGSRTYTLPSADGTSGQVLTTNGSGTLSWTTASGGVAGVTSFSAGTTGLTPAAASTGAVTLAGTLAVANGGTGQTTYTDGQLLIGNSTGNTLTKATLTAGTGVTITNGAGSITISSTGGLIGTTSSALTAYGISAGAGVTSGTLNTLIGQNAGLPVTTGVSNTMVGYEAGGGSTNVSFATYVGYLAGRNLQASNCTALGNSALQGVGGSASGTDNTAVGFWALRNITSASDNVAVGNVAGTNLSSGGQNTFVGSRAANSMTTGANSVAVGFESASSTTTGNFTTAVGYQASYSNVTGSSNTAIGYLASRNQTGSFNTSVGRGALQGAASATNSECVAVGVYALNVAASGVQNTAVGYGAGFDLVSSNWCTLIGGYAGQNVTSGSANTLIGYNTGVQITTGTTNCALGDSAYLNGNYTNSTCLGYDSSVSGSNEVQLGNSSTNSYYYNTIQARSDLRDKADIVDTDLGLDFIMALRPRKFRWDMREFYKPEKPKANAPQAEWDAYAEACKMSNLTHDGTRKRNRFHQGLIAQEVKATMDAMGVDFGGFQDHKINGGEDVLSLGYDEMVAPLIKAIQELKAEFDEYKRTHP